jgi:glycosyltransferase involved in cell wall biosynthesis
MSNLLSIYCFYKDELAIFPETVPTWLPFLAGGGELVLVDTGSSDGSPEWAAEVARSKPEGLGIDVRCEKLPWPEPLDWASITAQTMALCSRSWRMRLDADEKLGGDPRALASVLKNMEHLARLQDQHKDFIVDGAIPVAIGGLALGLYEPETGIHQYRSRLHRGPWRWRYRIDPAPVPPEGEEGGVFLLLQDWICHVVHTRASIRPEALARMEGVLELARRLDGPLDAMTEAHYQNGIDRVKEWSKKGEGL